MQGGWARPFHRPARPGCAEPLQRSRNQLRTVVYPQYHRRAAGYGEHANDHPAVAGLRLEDSPFGVEVNTSAVTVPAAVLEHRPIIFVLLYGLPGNASLKHDLFSVLTVLRRAWRNHPLLIELHRICR